LHGRIGNYSVEGAFNPSRKSMVLSKLKSTDRLSMGRHFDRTIVILCVWWHLRYKLRLRDLVEMLAEQGLVASHTTILSWVKCYTQEFVKH